MRNMISELRPASRAQFVSFGNVSKQDVIRASTWGIEQTCCGLKWTAQVFFFILSRSFSL